jgi:hypothetical protein
LRDTHAGGNLGCDPLARQQRPDSSTMSVFRCFGNNLEGFSGLPIGFCWFIVYDSFFSSFSFFSPFQFFIEKSEHFF